METPAGLRLICVDDECNALCNCKATLQQFSDIEAVHFFQTPSEAIAYVKDNAIDLAFLDIDMPEMDGFQLAEALRTLRPTVQVAFVTGNIRYMSPSNRKVKAPYVFKPYSAEDVDDVLQCVRLRA